MFPCLNYTHKWGHSVWDSPIRNHRSACFCGAVPVCEPILSLPKRIHWLKFWGGKWRETQLTRAQRVIGSIISDCWLRNPCNATARSISHNKSSHCITLRKLLGGEPTLLLVPAVGYLNSPRVLLSPIVSHPEVKHNESESCNSLSNRPSRGLKKSRKRVWKRAVFLMVLCATGRAGIEPVELSDCVRVHCFPPRTWVPVSDGDTGQTQTVQEGGAGVICKREGREALGLSACPFIG